MADFSETPYTGHGTTTNADEISYVSIPFNDNSSASITIRVLARRPSNQNTKIWVLAATAKRNGSTTSIVGGLTNLVSPIGDIGALGWDVSLEANGNNIDIVSQGQANATIHWFVTADVLYIAD